MEAQWLEQFVKYQGLSGEFFEFIHKEGISREELDELLRKNDLDTFAKRSRFLWKLQVVVEKVVYEHPYELNSDVADLVVKEWNEKFFPVIDKFVARAMLDNLPIRHDMMKQAFCALCSGNFSSYELYTQKDPQLFVQLFVRSVTQFVDRQAFIFPLAEVVLPSLFSDIHVRREVKKSLRSLLLVKRDNEDMPDYKMMYQYGQTFSPDELVFNKGLLNIIVPILKEKEEQEFIVNFLHNVEKKAKHLLMDEIIQEETKQTEIKEGVIQEGPQQVETVVEEKTNEMETAAVSSASIVSERLQHLAKEVERFATLMKTNLQELEQQLTYSNQSSETAEADSKEVIAQLKEENERLYMEIEKIKQQQAETEWKRFKQFVQAVGGNQNHYLLSELYEESQGLTREDLEITRGRLINLFNALSLFGLEPTAYGYEIGQELTLTRQELREKFMMMQQIVSPTNEVCVKIVRYGWMLYGQVIVQPLVEEVVK